MVLLEHSPVNLRPIHPIGIDDSGITPSIAKPIKIRVRDPLDHHAPAILHQPPGFKSAKSDGAAVVLISGAGGGVSGPAGIKLHFPMYMNMYISCPPIEFPPGIIFPVGIDPQRKEKKKRGK